MRVVVAIAVAAAAFAGCSNVDVHYVAPEGGAPQPDARPATDGATTPPDGNADASGGTESGADGAAPSSQDAGAPDFVDADAVGTNGFCGCDLTQGIGCCVLRDSQAFCSGSFAACTGSGGMFISCLEPDPSGDSACCWNGTGASGATAAASTCGTRPTACTADTDCAQGTACMQTTCGGIRVGACGTAPTCP